MTLLIDFLESAAAYIHERKERSDALIRHYRTSADPDIKKEMVLVRKEIGKKNTEIRAQILLNLDEFRYLHKYYPELLGVLMEDDCIGKTISKKSWLLEFKEIPANFAASKLAEIRNWRLQLKEVAKRLRRSESVKSLLAKYPFLHGVIMSNMDKSDAIDALKKSDNALNKEGWLVLISSSLIEIPLAKFISKLSKYQGQDYTLSKDLSRVRGHGTIAEVSALRKLQSVRRKKEHFENLIIQILLANPTFLRELKKKALNSHSTRNPLLRLANSVTPHTVRERVWLDEMKKRLED
ncbi:hypothetical protein HY988_05845 [Candidatus Micrarchaeota archaeon]|nr:hypothetical protein [Candidatus Micrarchaeota archaeon]